MNERLPVRPLLHSPESDSKSGGGRPPGEKTGFFHAPPRPGDLQKIETGKIESTAPQNDPTVSLLETLQAVKDKQQSGGGAARQEVSDIAGVQAEKSPAERLMSAQSVVFGATGLLLVLSIWGLIHLANRATESVPSSETSRRNDQASATQATQENPPPSQAGAVAQPPAPISRPTFKSQPLTPTLSGGGLRQQNATAIQAEKERLAREEQDRAQREKQREEEDRQERERQLRELEGRSAGENPAENSPPPPEAPPAGSTHEGGNPPSTPENQ
jgi:hypothetical protein